MIAKVEPTNDGLRISCRCGFAANVSVQAMSGYALLLLAGSKFELMHAHANPGCVADDDYVTLPTITTFRVKP